MERSFSLAVWIRQLPNQLTLARLAVIPALLIVYPLGFRLTNIICALVFFIAALTDFFDGYLARRHGTVTRLGALLDPVADKVLMGGTLVLLAHAQVVPAWVASLLVCRELAVSGLRLAALQQSIRVDVNAFGKIKTCLLDGAITCLLINEPLFDWPFRPVGMIALWLGLLASLYSAYQYFRAFFDEMQTHLNNPH